MKEQWSSPHQEHSEVRLVLVEVRHHSHHRDALLCTRHVGLLSFGVAEVHQIVHVAQVPQRTDPPEEAAAHHQDVLGAVDQQQLVVVVGVHGLLAGLCDGRRAESVVPLGARLGARLHLQVGVQLDEGVDGAHVQLACAWVGHHVVDQGVREELGVFALRWDEVYG